MPIFFARLGRGLIAAALLYLAAAPATALAQTAGKTYSAAEKAAIEKIVRDYILANPEIIPEAIQVLQSRMTTASITDNRQHLLDDGHSYVAGNPKGDVTIVEFFDYTCGYCKMVAPTLKKLLAEDKCVRLVLKEWPIRGAEAELASKAAIASRAQGKYLAFHEALLGHRGALNETVIFTTAAKVGLDVERLKKDMAEPEVARIIDANRKLGAAMNLRGTPAFIIGDELIPGAVGYDELVKQVAAARK